MCIKTRRKPWSVDRAWEFAHRPIDLAPPSLRPILESFSEWLRQHRGMEPGSIRVRITSTRDFLLRIGRGRRLEEVVELLDARRLERFFEVYSASSGRSALRSMRSAVRRFLQFAGEKNLVAVELADAVPSVRTYRLSGVVRAIADEDIRGLLESVDDGMGVGIRDRAILLVLACYGVRCGQASSLTLESIRWRDELIRFPGHKGGKAVEQPLLPEVASAVARYLREIRPPVLERTVFLRYKRPYSQLSPVAISSMVRHRLRAAGVDSASRGAHILRHAFAIRQLKAGRSLKSIADQLGHRHFTSAWVYTKVDQPSLRDVAVAWPEILR